MFPSSVRGGSIFACVPLPFDFFPREAPVQGFSPLKMFFLVFSLGNSQVPHIFPNESLPVVCAANVSSQRGLSFHFLCGVW